MRPASGCSVEDRAGLVLVEDLVPRERETAVGQRLDDVERERAAAGRDRADRAVGIVEAVLGEPGERRLVALILGLTLGLILGPARCLKHPGEKQAERNYDRDNAFVRQHFECPRPPRP